jgi:hypothetical protein
LEPVTMNLGHGTQRHSWRTNTAAGNGTTMILPSVGCPTHARHVVKMTSIRSVKDERRKFTTHFWSAPHLQLSAQCHRDVTVIRAETHIANLFLEVHPMNQDVTL